MTRGNGHRFERYVVCLVHIKSDTNHAPYFQNFTLALISSAAMIAGVAGNIQNRQYLVADLQGLRN
jgi:hypothetical protein